MNETVPRRPARRGLWLADIGLMILLVAFVGAIQVFAPQLAASLSGASLLACGALVAVVPALIWLVFFYLQDRLEPEPKAYIAKVFVLGAIIAMAVGIPLVRDVYGLNQWLYSSWWVHLLASVLVVGFSQES